MGNGKWEMENGKIPISQDPNLAPVAARLGQSRTSCCRTGMKSGKWKNGKVENPNK
jgi:hypothetical protein